MTAPRSPWREIMDSLHGVWRLSVRDPAGMGWLNLTVSGFWRSFLAAPIALPIFIGERRVAALLGTLLYPEREIVLSLPLELTIYALTWPAMTALLLGAAWLAGRTDRFAALVIALNWLTPGVLAALLVVGWTVTLAPQVLGFLLLGMHGFILLIKYRVVRIALEAKPAAAIGVVALSALFGYLFPAAARLLA